MHVAANKGRTTNWVKTELQRVEVGIWGLGRLLVMVGSAKIVRKEGEHLLLLNELLPHGPLLLPHLLKEETVSPPVVPSQPTSSPTGE